MFLPEKAGPTRPFLISPPQPYLITFALPPATVHTLGGLSLSNIPWSTLLLQLGAPFPSQFWTPHTGPNKTEIAVYLKFNSVTRNRALIMLTN